VQRILRIFQGDSWVYSMFSAVCILPGNSFQNSLGNYSVIFGNSWSLLLKTSLHLIICDEDSDGECNGLSVRLDRLKQSNSKKVTTKQLRITKDRKNLLSSPAMPPTITQGERTNNCTTYSNSANSINSINSINSTDPTDSTNLASSYVKIRAKIGSGPPAGAHRAVQAWQQHNTANIHHPYSAVS